MKRQNIHMKNHDLNTSVFCTNFKEKMKNKQVQYKITDKTQTGFTEITKRNFTLQTSC
jgi:hypothetical protein